MPVLYSTSSVLISFIPFCCCSSVAKSSTLWPHRLQHTRLLTSLRIFHSLLCLHGQRLYCSQWSRCFFQNSLASSMSQRMLAIWFLTLYKPSLYISKFSVNVLLKPSLFSALTCKHVKWAQLCGSLNSLWHCRSFGLKYFIHCSIYMSTLPPNLSHSFFPLLIHRLVFDIHASISALQISLSV